MISRSMFPARTVHNGATAPKGRGGMVRILDVVQGNGSSSFLGVSGSVIVIAAVVLVDAPSVKIDDGSD